MYNSSQSTLQVRSEVTVPQETQTTQNIDTKHSETCTDQTTSKITTTHQHSEQIIECLCRICRSLAGELGDDAGRMCSPCKCRGSLQYVHEKCLSTWLEFSNKKTCEICKHHFQSYRVLLNSQNIPSVLRRMCSLFSLKEIAFHSLYWLICALLFLADVCRGKALLYFLGVTPDLFVWTGLRVIWEVLSGVWLRRFNFAVGVWIDSINSGVEFCICPAHLDRMLRKVQNILMGSSFVQIVVMIALTEIAGVMSCCFVFSIFRNILQLFYTDHWTNSTFSSFLAIALSLIPLFCVSSKHSVYLNTDFILISYLWFLWDALLAPLVGYCTAFFKWMTSLKEKMESKLRQLQKDCYRHHFVDYCPSQSD